MTTISTDCVFCTKTYTGYGNNPAPLSSIGKACDECNFTRVIPYRIAGNFGLIKTEKLPLMDGSMAYACAVCDQPFENEEQVCWAGIEEFNEVDGNPLCTYCCNEMCAKDEESEDDEEPEWVAEEVKK
jgi:hypothetical protein